MHMPQNSIADSYITETVRLLASCVRNDYITIFIMCVVLIISFILEGDKLAHRIYLIHFYRATHVNFLFFPCSVHAICSILYMFVH
jgi:hypothetical protein